MSRFMKIRPVGAECFLTGRWTDRQKDMMKLIITLRNSTKVRKIANVFQSCCAMVHVVIR